MFIFVRYPIQFFSTQNKKFIESILHNTFVHIYQSRNRNHNMVQ